MISSQDLLVIGTLIFLEGILSIDNALVLAMLARPLPPRLQRRALTYGIVGASMDNLKDPQLMMVFAFDQRSEVGSVR